LARPRRWPAALAIAVGSAGLTGAFIAGYGGEGCKPASLGDNTPGSPPFAGMSGI